MTAQPQEKNKMTPNEYLVVERRSLGIKHEFFNGEIFAMVGAQRNHIYINANITRKLGNRFEADKSTCKVVSNDMRVKTADNYTYPDIVIHCQDAEFEDNEFDTLTNPVVIMEILSDSTEAFDRGDKFAYYQAIPALKEYILVSQKRYRVEQFILSDDGKWEYRLYEGTDQVLKMDSIHYELPLSEIYWDISFESK